MNRRDFLKAAGLTVAGAGLAGGPWRVCYGQDPAPDLVEPGGPVSEALDERFVRPAMFFDKMDEKKVQCRLCPRKCEVADGRRGRCGVRQNIDGEYFTLVYGRTVALNNDPIEKKPFYHFCPGTMVLSLATAGCNLACKFCQNWQISQFKPEEVMARYILPEEHVMLARRHGIPNIAFTYNEPTVFYEYMYETARQGSEAGIKCVTVSNGFISPEAVKKLAPHLAAYKVDLKAYTQAFYKDYCSARLTPVLDTLETLVGLGMWVEIVNLVLPTANDSEKDIRAMARWIKTNLGPMVPVHFTRFHPMYKIRNLPPTPVSTLETCHDAAVSEGLKYVYIGNVPGHPLGNTHCHNCNRLLIERTGLWSVESYLEAGRCPDCQTEIPGVWS
jgi:pyruvate formate lyase activating enzyme